MIVSRIQVLLWRLRDERGQTTVEYALIAGALAVGMTWVLGLLYLALEAVMIEAAQEIEKPPG
jgi:Flp pilus assembly pilin Flp